MQAKNLKEFKWLIEFYDSITLDEIIEYDSRSNLLDDFYAIRTMNNIYAERGHDEYGFGSMTHCILCTATTLIQPSFPGDILRPTCGDCAYFLFTKIKCGSGCNEKTYLDMRNAMSPEELLTAVKARAAYMKKIMEDYEKSINEND